MKTLNEVITIMDGIDQTCTCCAYQHDCDETECVEKTALHYLKVLQKMQKAQPVTKGEWDELYNNPLTWDELRTMEGKPVWIEMDGYKPNWGIIMNQDKINGRLLLCGYDEVEIRIEIDEDSEGIHWKAYRKERG